MQKEEMYQQGHIFYKEGRYHEAIESLDNILQIDSNFMFAHYLKGLSYIGLGDWEKVITTFEQVLELAPQEGDAHVNIGVGNYNLKNYDKAIEHLKKSLELGTQDNKPDRIYYNLGLACKDKALTTNEGGIFGKWEGAMQAFKKCLEINPNYAVAHFQLGVILCSMQCYYDAIEYFEKIIAFDPESTHPTVMESWVGIATCHCGLDNYEETLKSLEKAIQIDERVKGVAKVDFAFEKIRNSGYADEFAKLVE